MSVVLWVGQEAMPKVIKALGTALEGSGDRGRLRGDEQAGRGRGGSGALVGAGVRNAQRTLEREFIEDRI